MVKKKARKRKTTRKKIKKQEGKEKRVIKKEQIKSENRILKNFFIGIGIVVVVIVLFILIVNSTKNFENTKELNLKLSEREIWFYTKHWFL